LEPDDHSDFAANKFCRQFGKTIRMAFSRLDIKLNILPFDIPSVAKSFSERHKKFFWTRNANSEDTDRCGACGEAADWP
jgi:hypothetical protein